MAASTLRLPSLACEHPSRRSLSLVRRLRIQAMKLQSDAGNRHENETDFSPLDNSSKLLSLATQLTARSRATANSNHRDEKTPTRFLRARTRYPPWPCLKREPPFALHAVLLESHPNRPPSCSASSHEDKRYPWRVCVRRTGRLSEDFRLADHNRGIPIVLPRVSIV